MPKCFFLNIQTIGSLKGTKKKMICVSFWFLKIAKKNCIFPFLEHQTGFIVPKKTESVIMILNNFLTLKFFGKLTSDVVAVEPAGGALLWWETLSYLGWKQSGAG